mmetsp:Transcript_34016/g.68062  ORF Transcript_34016/g.68062 Transcript_34016/m.68062 type:complete len:217 (+) Transcript_34016:83-733(+)
MVCFSWLSQRWRRTGGATHSIALDSTPLTIPGGLAGIRERMAAMGHASNLDGEPCGPDSEQPLSDEMGMAGASLSAEFIRDAAPSRSPDSEATQKCRRPLQIPTEASAGYSKHGSKPSGPRSPSGNSLLHTAVAKETSPFDGTPSNTQRAERTQRKVRAEDRTKNFLQDELRAVAQSRADENSEVRRNSAKVFAEVEVLLARLKESRDTMEEEEHP